MTQEMESSRAESDAGATTTGESGDRPDVPQPETHQPSEPPAPPKAEPSADANPAEPQQQDAAEEAAAGAGGQPQARSEQEAGGASDAKPQAAEAEIPGLDGLDIMNEMRGMLEKLDSLKQDCEAAAPEVEAEAAQPAAQPEIEPKADGKAPESEPQADGKKPGAEAEPQAEPQVEEAPQKLDPSLSPQEQPQADAAAGGADDPQVTAPVLAQAPSSGMVIRWHLLGFTNQAMNTIYTISASIQVGGLQTYWSQDQDYFMYFCHPVGKWQISPRTGPGDQPGLPDVDLLQDAMLGGQRGLAMQVEETAWREWVEGAWHLVDLQVGSDNGDGEFHYTAQPPAPIWAAHGSADAAAGAAPSTPASGRLPMTPQGPSGVVPVPQRMPQTPRDRLLQKAGLVVAGAPGTPMAARTGMAAPTTPMAARRMPQTPTGAAPAWGAAAPAVAEAPSPEPAMAHPTAAVAAKILSMPERFLPEHLKAPQQKRRKVNEEPTLFNFGKAVNRFTVWVGFFPEATTLEELKQVFSGCGPIYDKEIKGTQALLHFSSSDDRLAALELGTVAIGGYRVEVRPQEHFEEVPEPAAQEQDQATDDAAAQAQEAPQADDQQAAGQGGWQGEDNQNWSGQQGGNWKQQAGGTWGGAAAGGWGGQSQANDQGSWAKSEAKDQGSWGQSQTKDQGSWGQSQAKEQGSWGGNSWGNGWGAKSEGAAGGDWSEDKGETLEIPRDMAGRIIGRQGATIKALQDSSGARIKLNKPEEESEPCVVSVSGKPACIAEGLRLVKELIASGNAKGKGKGKEKGKDKGKDGSSNGPGSTETMEIPKNSVRDLIGKDGETIKRLQAESGARLQVNGNKKWDTGPCSVTMSGTPEAVAAARALVQQAVGEQMSAGGGGGWSAPASGGGWSAPAGGSWSAGAAADQGAGGAAEAKPAKGKGKGLLTDSLAIPPEKESAVAGVGGEGIKRLQQQTGARVTLESGDADQGQPCRVCFSGSKESISRAKALVRTIAGVPAQPLAAAGAGGPAFPGPAGAASAFSFSQKLKSGSAAGAIDVSAAAPSDDAAFEQLCQQMAEHPPGQDEFDKLYETAAAQAAAVPRPAARPAPRAAAAQPASADDEFEKLCAEEAGANPPEAEGGGAAGAAPSPSKAKAKAKGKARAKAKGKAAEDKAAEAEKPGADGDAAAGAAAPAKRRGRTAKAAEGAPPEKKGKKTE